MALLLLPVHPAAHPDHDHDEKSVLIGSVTRVQHQAIEVETFDHVGMRLRTVLILIDEETTFLEKKSPVETLDLARGERVEATVLISHAADGSDQFRAVKIRRL